MRILLGLFLIPLAACDDPAPAATLREVPSAFIGRWDVSLADCDVGSGPQTVSVGPSEIIFSDSHLGVTGAAPDGTSAVRADGHFKTEQAEWDGSVRLELADGGRVLNVVNGSALVPRVKCP